MINWNTIKSCPSCGGKMEISRFACKECGIEICGNFEMSIFQELTEKEIDFIKNFLRMEGNISKMQEIENCTYNTVKNILQTINIKLGVEIQEEKVMTNIIKNENDSKVICLLKEKILACGGKAFMPTLKGEPISFWVSSTQRGFESAGLKKFVFEWEVFDAIVKKANELGGKMYRGDAAAHSGARIGTEELPIDTIDGFVAMQYFGAKIGDTTLRRSTYYAGILAWAGIVTNHRSQGKGGFITVNADFRE